MPERADSPDLTYRGKAEDPKMQPFALTKSPKESPNTKKVGLPPKSPRESPKMPSPGMSEKLTENQVKKSRNGQAATQAPPGTTPARSPSPRVQDFGDYHTPSLKN